MNGVRGIWLASRRAPLRTMPERVSPIARLKALIDCEYARPLTLKTLAAAVGKERTYTATLFRRLTGETLHGYLTAVRVRRAGDLIRQGHKIEAVMLLVGYRSKKSFYRQFRARTGLTPGAYRINNGPTRRTEQDRRIESRNLRIRD